MGFMEREMTDIEIKDIEGIGPTITKKLKLAGITSVMDLAVQSSDDLALEIGGTREAAAEHIGNALKLLKTENLIQQQFVPMSKALEQRQNILRCSTGSETLDEFLLGGIETQAITEFYGEFGSGKSQICHTLCAMAPQPLDQGGLDGAVLYLDTEGTYRPERIEQIANARGLDVENIKNKVFVSKIYNSSNLELIIQKLGTSIDELNAKVIIVDSIISLHRADYTGRGTLADRQQRLNPIMHKLVRFSEIYNMAVVITNQVTVDPSVFFGDPTKPTGGNVVGHASTYRVYLRKSGHNRIVKMVDSPYHPYGEIKITINEKGIDDVPEEKKKDKEE